MYLVYNSIKKLPVLQSPPSVRRHNNADWFVLFRVPVSERGFCSSPQCPPINALIEPCLHHPDKVSEGNNALFIPHRQRTGDYLDYK